MKVYIVIEEADFSSSYYILDIFTNLDIAIAFRDLNRLDSDYPEGLKILEREVHK